MISIHTETFLRRDVYIKDTKNLSKRPVFPGFLCNYVKLDFGTRLAKKENELGRLDKGQRT